MARVKLSEQQNYKFQYHRTIGDCDLNYAGHLGNDRLVGIIQEARIEVFKELGFKELDTGDGKTGIIIGDLVVNFRAEVFSGDELRIDSGFNEVSEKSLRAYHRMIRVTDSVLIGLVETGLIAYDYERRSIAKFPSQFLKSLDQARSDLP